MKWLVRLSCLPLIALVPRVASQTAPTPQVDWVQVAKETDYEPRDSCGEVVFRGHMWLLGGWFNSYETPPRDVWKSRDGKNWEIVTNRAPWKHSDFAMTVVFEDRIWTMGGWYNGRLPNASASNAVWSSQDGKAWQQVTPQAGWTPRMAAGCAVFNGRIWILGGVEKYYFGDYASYRNDVWSSADGKTWEQVTASAPWSARAYHHVLVFDGKLWVIGGGRYLPHYRDHRDVWCSSDGVNWTEVTAEAAWPGRLWFSTAVYRGRMWLLGGWSQDPVNPPADATDVWRPNQLPVNANWNDVWHSADGRTWERLKTKTIWKTRHEHSAYVFEDKLWVVAGHTRPLANDAWSLYLPPGWPLER